MPLSDDEEVGISNLKVHRGVVKGQMTKLKTYLETKANTANQFELETKLGLLESYFNNFHTIQSAIETAEPEIVGSDREIFEELYFNFKSLLLALINKLVPRPSLNDSTIAASLPTNQHRRSLPKIKLPIFSGVPTEWTDFINIFEELVGKDGSLTEVEKFQHLRNSLSSSAYNTIKAYENVPENYVKAITYLKGRYGNKRYIFQAHINEIFQLRTNNKPSLENIRQQNDIINSNMRALRTISTKEQIADGLLLQLITGKLDSDTQAKWEEQVALLTSAGRARHNEEQQGGNGDDFTFLPSFEQFSEFLAQRCQMFEFLESNKAYNYNQQTTSSKPRFDSPRSRQGRSSLVTTQPSVKCIFCSMDHHSPFQCPKFTSLTPVERFNEAKRMNLCLNCLKTGHGAKNCKSSKCQRCHKTHHTLLHMQNEITIQPSHFTHPTSAHQINRTNNADLSRAPVEAHNSQLNTTGTISLIASNHSTPDNLTRLYNSHNHILLATAVVNILDINGIYQSCRALLDSASQLNFVSEALINRLGLKKIRTNQIVSGIGGINANAKFKADFTIKSVCNDYTASLEALLLPKIICHQPDHPIDTNQLNIPENIRLADPSYYQPQAVDLLIGASLFFELLSIGQIKLGPNQPILQKTVLGWILAGPIGENNNSAPRSHTFCTTSNQQSSIKEVEIELLMKKFWDVENPDIEIPTQSDDDKLCEELYVKNTTRTVTGRYMVRLPFRQDPSVLGGSYNTAVQRFYSLERKLNSSETLKADYTRFINDYIAQNHMQKISKDQLKSPHFFLPHHSVIKQEISSSKLRVVFDGSCKTSSGRSLNDILLIGPTIQPDLFTIITRFRLHRYVISSDITQMYRQILMDPKDRDLQCIVWRENQQSDLQIYRLNTVTYGTSAAAFLAIRSLVQLAQDEQKDYGVGSKAIIENFYVDNLMAGANSIPDTLKIKREVTSILAKGGFVLRKWCSNEPSIIHDITQEDRETKIHIDNDTTVIKTLGLYWDPISDHFSFYHTTTNPGRTVTKRAILSEIARLFDPLGFINPIIVTAKIILQHIWRIKLDWDESIPQDLSTQWYRFKEQFPVLNSIKIKRHVISPNARIQIHGFCDASESAYGAVIYIRSENDCGFVETQLACAKSKVAPLGKITLPKLELCAALLLAILVNKVKRSFEVADDNIYYWSDSTIVIAWINTHSFKLTTFVAHRVAKIQGLTTASAWNHVPTTSNPADAVSRGMTAKRLVDSPIWLNGPDFLKLPPTAWPKFTIPPNLIMPERKKTKYTLIASEVVDITAGNKFSNSYFRIISTFAYIQRFISNCINKLTRYKGPLTPEEIDRSLVSIIRNIQQTQFSEDYTRLATGKPLKANSKLKGLAPFLDANNVIRVGGRLRNADLSFDSKHQMLLPSKHPFTEAMIQYHHLKNLHCGCQTLLNLLRQRVWIINGKNTIKGVIRSCILCFKYRPFAMQQIMGNLPSDRITPSRPFSIAGVDLCGPFNMSLGIRGKTPIKVYVAIFICFSTKAVHLEMVQNLSTQAFIQSLKRFISRRGNCKKIFSDNATNFVGCKNELRQLRELFLSQNHNELVQAMCLQDGIEWCFIPPRSPNFGGLWESAVKLAKTHMLKVMGNANLNTFELATLLCQIEAILNSRPITPISNDPNDLTALTPGHFLVGAQLNSFNEPVAHSDNPAGVKNHHRLCVLQSQFWKRWKNEYLNTLQVRSRWNKQNHNIAVDDLVIIKDDNTPSLKWPMGRIIEVHPGDDGSVRVATIKTPHGTYKRSISKICRLPIHKSVVESNTFQGRRHVQF